MRRGVVKRALLQTESLAAAGRALRETDEAQLAALRLKLDQLTPRHQLLKAQYEKILLAERTRLEAQVTQQPAGGGGAAAAEEEEDREDREETGEVVQEREWASSRECSMDDGCGVSASSQDWSGPAWKAVDGDNNPVCRLVTRRPRPLRQPKRWHAGRTDRVASSLGCGVRGIPCAQSPTLLLPPPLLLLLLLLLLLEGEERERRMGYPAHC